MTFFLAPYSNVCLPPEDLESFEILFFVPISNRINQSEIKYPTDPFTILELQDSSIDISKLHKGRLSPDYEALKLWMGRSGTSLSTFKIISENLSGTIREGRLYSPWKTSLRTFEGVINNPEENSLSDQIVYMLHMSEQRIFPMMKIRRYLQIRIINIYKSNSIFFFHFYHLVSPNKHTFK